MSLLPWLKFLGMSSVLVSGSVLDSELVCVDLERGVVNFFMQASSNLFCNRPAFGGPSLAAGNDTGVVFLLRWPLSSRNATQSSNMTSRDGVLYTRMWAFATSSTWTYPIRPSFPKSLPPAGATSMFKKGMLLHEDSSKLVLAPGCSRSSRKRTAELEDVSTTRFTEAFTHERSTFKVPKIAGSSISACMKDSQLCQRRIIRFWRFSGGNGRYSGNAGTRRMTASSPWGPF